MGIHHEQTYTSNTYDEIKIKGTAKQGQSKANYIQKANDCALTSIYMLISPWLFVMCAWQFLILHFLLRLRGAFVVSSLLLLLLL